MSVTAKQKRVTAKKPVKLKLVHKATKVVISPADLHTILQPTQTEVMFFNDEKAMRRYRQMLYTINAQGEFSYRTLRNPEDHRELIVWRMK